MQSITITITLFSCLFISACTWVTVDKISPNTDSSKLEGLRFGLPKPYIQVTPKEDGSISAEIVYLPDPDRTYVIRSRSFLAYDSLEVITKEGIIQNINWTGDSSAVAADAITSAGGAVSSILQAEQTKRAEQRTKEEAASKAVDDAQLEYDQAQNKLMLLKDRKNPDATSIEIYQAQVEVESAGLKVMAARTALDRIRGLATSDASFREKELEAFNKLESARKAVRQAEANLETAVRGNQEAIRKSLQDTLQAERKKLKEAEKDFNAISRRMFGPKLFAIRDELRLTPDGKNTEPFLELIAVKQKAPYEGQTSDQPSYPVTYLHPPIDEDLRIFPDGRPILVPDTNNKYVILLSASKPIRFVSAESSFTKDATKAAMPPIVQTSPTTIEVDLHQLAIGNYKLTLAYQLKSHTDPNEIDGKRDIDFKIKQKSS